MTVYLRPGRPPIVAELHAPFYWKDPFTRRDESYLRGFTSDALAHAYAAGQGWTVIKP